MSEVWTGSITTDNPSVAIGGAPGHTERQINPANKSTGVHLWSTSPLVQCPFSQNTRLHFLSLVHVDSVPLYLAAGPSLDVSTDDEHAAAWLSEGLLVDQAHQDNSAFSEPWWSHLGQQSDQGILLRVQDDGAGNGIVTGITELLLYAAVKTSALALLPTPPVSSSPAPFNGDSLDPSAHEMKNIKVYALPLSSINISRVLNGTRVASRDLGDSANDESAYFLPDPVDESKLMQRVHQKRQSLSSLFDDATQKRQKLKVRGGESVAQAMANVDRPVLQSGPLADFKDESQLPPKSSIRRKGLSRASSMSSMPVPEYARPSSRSGALANGKRSSLHRVESAISPRDSPAFSDADDSNAQQNRTALIKVIMAGMRLYGLQQKKKSTKAQNSHGPPPASGLLRDAAGSSETEDEYKVVYHQTFKAATFVFRRQLSGQLIPQETMRDVVDRFLSLFCIDPLSSIGFTGGDVPAFGTQGSDSAGIFDLPSTSTLPPMAPKTCSTPRTKKR